MKIRKSILLSVLVAVLVTGAVIVLLPRPRNAGISTESDEPGRVTSQPTGISEAPDVGDGVGRNSAVIDLPEVAHAPAKELRVRAGFVLARVNDKPLQAKDLAPLESEGTEKTMTREEYESRLNRAIEMELTFQAAAAQSVDLTAGQKQRLDNLAQHHAAMLDEYRKQGLTWSSVTESQIEFEKRLTAALMLQQNLVAKQTGTAPSTDVANQTRFEEALQQMLASLKSNAQISTASANL